MAAERIPRGSLNPRVTVKERLRIIYLETIVEPISNRNKKAMWNRFVHVIPQAGTNDAQWSSHRQQETEILARGQLLNVAL
jgi:hypothetical protein